MGSGYFLKGFADALTSPGLMGGGSKLAKEQFEYKKQRDVLEDAQALKKQQDDAVIKGLLQQKTLQDIATGNFVNEDRQGAENFYRRALRPQYPDAWQDKHMDEKGLKELGLMAGTAASNDQSQYLGGEGAFNSPVDSTILTTRARIDDNKLQRDLENKKLNTPNKPTSEYTTASIFSDLLKKDPGKAQNILDSYSAIESAKSSTGANKKNNESATLFTALELKYDKNTALKFSKSGLKPDDVRAMYKLTKAADAPKNKIELTRAALAGDKAAQDLLKRLNGAEITMAKDKGEAAAAGKIAGLSQYMDIEGTAKAVLAGRETIENVRNTMGVPVQDIVRAKVLKAEPDFNFIQPRAQYVSLKSSLQQQQKNYGSMGSFVKNINGQVDRIEEMSRDIISRVGIRALDVPIRALATSFIGSGNENVFTAYMKEISNEINKLSQGSTASIAQLPVESQKAWDKIHDPNLSLKEMIKVLNGTRDMANIRIKSVSDNINETVSRMSNIRNTEIGSNYKEGQTATGPNGEKKIYKNGKWGDLK